MKKILSLFIFLLLLVGCSLANSPTSKVEDLLTKYQTLDKDIKTGIDEVINEETLTSEQKDRYRNLIEKQYKNLAYQIKDERIDGDTATITTEIEVLDYKKAINEAVSKYQDRNDYTVEEYNNSKLDSLEKTKEKVKYTIDFSLTKIENEWKLDDLLEIDRQKIHGLYK